MACVAGALMWMVTAIHAGGSASPRPVIHLNAGDLDTGTLSGGASHPAGSSSARGLALVQLAGPTSPAAYKALMATGVRVVDYVPDFAYLVYGDSRAMAGLASLVTAGGAFVWQGPFLAAYKTAGGPLRPGAVDASGYGPYAVQMVADPEANAATLELLATLGDPFLSQYQILDYLTVIVPLPASALDEVAARPDVVSVSAYAEPAKAGERQCQILAGNTNASRSAPAGPGYLSWLASRGFQQSQFDASGFVVDVTDSGIDNGTTSPVHFGLRTGGDAAGAGRVAYARVEGTAHPGSTLKGCDGHGTLNAHIAAGYGGASGFPFADDSGYRYGQGVCPFVKVGSSVVFDPYAWTYPNLAKLQSDAYRDGARISSNSWGSPAAGAYTVDSQAYDALVRDAQPAASPNPAPGNQEMVVVFSAGNDGPYAGTTGAPGTAKNVITVGASENVHPFGSGDGCGVVDAQADDARDLASFSSRGPCRDGRHKPDVVAPGTHVTGGVAQAAAPPPDGSADFCFTGASVCGGTLADLFFPAGQQWYTASSGTSHACPAVAGAAVLLRQWRINGGNAPPSPALTKGWLMNSARVLPGAGAGDDLWSDGQGMGLVDMKAAFAPGPALVRDQVPSDLLTASGQSRVFTGTVADPSRPFRVTLAWTDAPGSTVGAAYKNDLDLAVTVGGRTYLGNAFSGGLSAAGGGPDRRDNVESVFLPQGTSGTFKIEVKAWNVNSDGVPGNGEPLDQDFALVASNASEGAVPVLVPDGVQVVSEGCFPANGAADPAETVTLALSLRNVGTAPTAGLEGLLAPAPLVLSNGSGQYFGGLLPGGDAAARPFACSLGGACGETAQAVVDLWDGGLSVGTVSFDVPLGGSAGCCVGTLPNPIADGLWVPGEAMRAERLSADGARVAVTWDASGAGAACPVSDCNLYAGSLADVASLAYGDWSNAHLGGSGTASATLPPGDVFFVLVPVDGSVEGSHGRDGAGAERPASGAGHGGVLVKDASAVCP